MATATITTTLDPRLNGVMDIQSFIARGGKLEIGEILFDGGTNADGGITWAPVQLDTVLYVGFSPEDADAGGYIYTYDYDNGKIQIYESGTASAALDEGDTSDTLSATVRYFALGF